MDTMEMVITVRENHVEGNPDGYQAYDICVMSESYPMSAFIGCVPEPDVTNTILIAIARFYAKNTMFF